MDFKVRSGLFPGLKSYKFTELLNFNFFKHILYLKT